MAIDLVKGQKIDLSKDSRGSTLEQVGIGLGWGGNGDLDASVFLLGPDGRVAQDTDFIFYKNLTSPCKSVFHGEDALEGGDEDDGDDEQIFVDLTKVPGSVDSIVIAVTIYADARNFSDAPGAYVRVGKASNIAYFANGVLESLDMEDSDEIARYELQGDYSQSDAVIFGALKRDGNAWKFEALGEGLSVGIGAQGLGAVARSFGVNA